MISVKIFSLVIKTKNSSFLKHGCIFDIFHHLVEVEQSKSELWNGEKLWQLGINII